MQKIFDWTEWWESNLLTTQESKKSHGNEEKESIQRRSLVS